MDVGLTSLTPYLDSGWSYDTSLGYYVHQGRTYLVGAVNAVVGGAEGSATILQGLPPSVRPVAPTAVKLLIDTENSTSEYAPDSSLHIGPFLPATVYPNGSLTLDGGNPFSGDPSTLLSLIFSGAFWATAAATADTYTPSSLAPHITTDHSFEVGTATFAIHNGRLHLDGHAVVGTGIRPFATRMLYGLPPEARPVIVETGGSNWTEVPTPGGYRGLALPDGSFEVHGPLARVPGNSGSGFLDNIFYEQFGDGYVARGSNPALGGIIGYSGSPVAVLQATSNWYGTIFTASPRFVVADLDPNPLSTPEEVYTSGTHYYLFAGGEFKMVFTYTSPNMGIWLFDSSGLYLGGGFLAWSGGANFDRQIIVHMSLRPFTGAVMPGIGCYFDIDIGGAYGWATPVSSRGGPFGDCGATASMDNGHVMIAGLGDFPLLVPGDVIDLTGCGWPLAYTPPPPPPLVPTTVIPGDPTTGPLSKKLKLGGKAWGKLSNQARYSIANMVHLAQGVGLVGESAATAGAIGQAESAGSPTAENTNTDGSRDRGLWQINDRAHPDVSDACAYDPVCCAHAMYAISSGGTNWTPWATYNAGLHLPYMAEARAVAGV